MMSSSRTPLPYASVMKPTRSACALSRSKPSRSIPAMPARCARIPRVRMQRGLADTAGAADAAEQRAGLSACHRLPRLESPRRAGLGLLAARQADLRPLPRRIGLAARNAQPQSAGDHADILDLQCHEFGATQRAGEAEQQECAVAPAARTWIAGGQQTAQHR